MAQSAPKGMLPVFSCATEQQARDLVVATCKVGARGVYYAPELAGPGEQTLENLEVFSERLAEMHDFLMERSARYRALTNREEGAGGR